MYQYGSPVKYIDETGKVRDKQTRLSSTVDKVAYAADYGYVNKGGYRPVFDGSKRWHGAAGSDGGGLPGMR